MTTGSEVFSEMILTSDVPLRDSFRFIADRL